MTSIVTPSIDFKIRHADVLQQMGATDIAANDPRTVAVTFPTAAQAANASALFKDTVNGATLLVQSAKPSTGHARPSATGMADLLRGIGELEVYEIVDGAETEIVAASFDAKVGKSLHDLVDSTPMPGVTVSVPVELR